ncbi:MAG: DNA primase [Bacteroidetes bacterium]|uniref:DNA primase n=1 Tax=Phaeocystidibacter marisrubri TaxID=1577780 RepID=A0A6L3ZGS0_9FLAO|nr:DNA primase [Phaeocystidibacter marisrubri]KAB2816149.1 DNA primase [Phaeocystidibacter marisrubri]TNE26294.1 MAG: DNA primase [Bacteroidota bacterium]GGH67581.1 DNA primase [Phaeocystidibacter marisrubri]
MGRISQETVEKVFDAARIEEVIGEFVNLKRAGASLKGLSPFTDEKTPSFIVSPAKQIYKDFSSGKGGTVVTFLMEHEHFTYPEALRYLARKYNIEIEEDELSTEQQEAATERESLHIISEYAQKYFEDQLWNSDEGRSIGLSYFKERGFTEETIKSFHLGYSPNGRGVFSKEALSKGYVEEFLVKSGVSIKRDNGELVDRFWGRVMFPIHSLSGRTLGFGGRVLRSDAKTAKYLNSPESEIYHKSKILYGLYQAKTHVVKADKCLLVEGYTDVISLSQAGIKNVVSSSGTALTVEQIRLVRRLTNNITILYDGDAAGIKASFRGIDLILEEGLNVRVLLFPDGEDPDSFARKHPAHELEDFINEEETDFIRFKAKLLMADAKNDPIGKANVIRDIVQSIALIPDDISRDVYLRECASIMDMEEKVLYSELAQLRKKHIDDKSKRTRSDERRMEVVRDNTPPPEVLAQMYPEAFLSDAQDSLHYKQEEAIIWILLNHAADEIRYDAEPDNPENKEKIEEPAGVFVMEELFHDGFAFENAIFQKVYNIIAKQYDEDETIPSGQEFARSEDQAIASMATDLMTERHALSDWKRKEVFVTDKIVHLSRYTMESVLRFKACKVEKLIADAKEKLRDHTVEDKTELLVQISKYTAMRNKINHQLNRVL